MSGLQFLASVGSNVGFFGIGTKKPHVKFEGTTPYLKHTVN